VLLCSSKEGKTQIECVHVCVCVRVCMCLCVGPVAKGTARGIVRIIFSLPPYWICAITAQLKAKGTPIKSASVSSVVVVVGGALMVVHIQQI